MFSRGCSDITDVFDIPLDVLSTYFPSNRVGELADNIPMISVLPNSNVTDNFTAYYRPLNNNYQADSITGVFFYMNADEYALYPQTLTATITTSFVYLPEASYVEFVDPQYPQANSHMMDQAYNQFCLQPNLHLLTNQTDKFLTKSRLSKTGPTENFKTVSSTSPNPTVPTKDKKEEKTPKTITNTCLRNFPPTTATHAPLDSSISGFIKNTAMPIGEKILKATPAILDLLGMLGL